MAQTKPIGRILLCEKNAFFRDEIFKFVQFYFPDVEIKWVMSSDDCLCEVGNFRPDILFLGSSIYKSDKVLNLIDQLRYSFPGLTIIFSSDYCIEEYEKEAIKRGAKHFISKEFWAGKNLQFIIQALLASKKRKFLTGAADSNY